MDYNDDQLIDPLVDLDVPEVEGIDAEGLAEVEDEDATFNTYDITGDEIEEAA